MTGPRGYHHGDLTRALMSAATALARADGLLKEASPAELAGTIRALIDVTTRGAGPAG